MKVQLIERIKKKEARVAVIGLGYVGLPTAAVFANVGFPVIAADIKPEIIEAIERGKTSTKEPGLDELVKKLVKKGMRATTNVLQAVKEADVIVVCVQTPLTSDKKPDLRYLKKACETVARGLSKGKLVIIESTIPPGTTRNLARSLEKISGLMCGREFWLAHCPERIAPGRALQEFIESARVVGGYNRESSDVAAELFKASIKGDVLVTDSTSAEVTKLAENTFRDVNIAFANELALLCEQMGADVRDVIKLANTHPRVNIHQPGCGVGGPCLPKDPHFLLSGARKGVGTIIKSSRKLNDLMPKHTVELAIEELKKAGKNVKKSKVAVLGTAYKGEIDDARYSPAEGIIRRLKDMGAKVVVYDPYSEENFGVKKAADITEAVREADCIVIATDHKMFEKLNFAKIRNLMNSKPIIVDGRGIVKPKNVMKLGFKYRGIGTIFIG